MLEIVFYLSGFNLVLLNNSCTGSVWTQFRLVTFNAYSYQYHLFCGVGHYDFCEVDDDFDVDYVFRTAFGGSRGFSFSFIHEEEPRWRHHSSKFSNNSKKSWRSKFQMDEEEEDDGYTSTDSSDSDSEPNQASHRQALGLSPSGPLNLKVVKDA